jgi:hypothetical protein
MISKSSAVSHLPLGTRTDSWTLRASAPSPAARPRRGLRRQAALLRASCERLGRQRLEPGRTRESWKALNRPARVWARWPGAAPARPAEPTTRWGGRAPNALSRARGPSAARARRRRAGRAGAAAFQCFTIHQPMVHGTSGKHHAFH